MSMFENERRETGIEAAAAYLATRPKHAAKGTVGDVMNASNQAVDKVGADHSSPQSNDVCLEASVAADTNGMEITATVTNAHPAHQQAPSSAAETIRKFLETVLVWPQQHGTGWINLHVNRKNDTVSNGGKPWVIGWPYKDISEFIRRSLWIDNTEVMFNVWMCMSQQSERGTSSSGKAKAVRNANNATWLKSIWIDCDVKPKPADHPVDDPWDHYETLEEARSALDAFAAKMGLPAPSAIVNSGGGLHVYWIADKPLSPGEWRPYAEGLKALLQHEGIKCDIGLTTDIARLLRVPGTLNHKYDPPRPVQLLHRGKAYDFPTALAVLCGAAPTKRAANTVSPSLQPAIEPVSQDEDGGWFAKLVADKQSEVVRYAARHIAKNSQLFELTANGGNYDNYLKLTFAIARSDVADAEDIFVEAASTAKGADPEDSLRKFFDGCRNAEPPEDGVTVGTLLHLATQRGADFDRWKQIADACDANVAVFVPGNEGECRKRLDRVVANDPNTFTLGDPTGPLVILRKPEGDALPSGTQWDGGLPGTTLATSADIMERAERLVWKRRARGKGEDAPDKGEDRLTRTHPPRPFVSDYLAQMRGRYSARPLRGIVRVPRIDENGDIPSFSGYRP
jgi:hypothetical protein